MEGRRPGFFNNIMNKKLCSFIFLYLFLWIFSFPVLSQEGYRVFVHPEGNYKIVLPPGWKEYKDGEEIYFQINRNNLDNASCFVSFFPVDPGTGVEELVGDIEDYYNFKGYGIENKLIAKEKTTVSGTEAILIRQKMDYDTGPFKMTAWSDYYYLIKNGEGIVLYFLTTGNYDRYQKDFSEMVRTFNCGENSVDVAENYSPPVNNNPSSHTQESPYNDIPLYTSGPAKEWIDRGNNLYKEQKYDNALTCYDKALGLEPQSLEGWYGRANCLYAKGNYYEALLCFDRVLEFAPDHAITLNNKAYLLYKVANYQEALKCIDKALEKNPHFVAALDTRGSILTSLGEYEQALLCYDKAIEIDPQNAYIWNNKGLLLFKEGKYSEAISCYEKALEINPSYSEAENNRLEALKKFSEKY